MSPTKTRTRKRVTTPTARRPWRIVDIVVAAVLGVATGLIFWAWNNTYRLIEAPLTALTPGLGGLLAGVWLIGGVVGGLVIRKPGAAVLVELIAAVVSALLGSSFGVTALYSGLAQGLGAELVFALFGYRHFRRTVAILAGAAAAAAEFGLEWFVWAVSKQSATYQVVYLVCMLISGAVIAGAGGWYLVRALARAGVLNQFPAGRETRRRV